MEDLDFYKTLIHRYLSGTASRSEAALFFRLLESGELDSLMEDQLRDDLSRELSTIRKKNRERIRRQIGVAASILLCVTSLWLFLPHNKAPKAESTNPVSIAKDVVLGQIDSVLLSDGTQVWLNAGSKIEYPKQFDGSERKVKISGEAFFDVAHNAKVPFVIETEQKRVKVYGTSFNVKSYKDEKFTVAVKTGKVGVKDVNDEKEWLLTKNDLIIYSEKSKARVLKNQNLETVLAWKLGDIVFDGNSLAEILPAIQRKYNVKIKLSHPDIGKLQMIGRYKNTSLNTLLEAMKFSLNIGYEKKGEHILLSMTDR
ncbi:FecR domain-containing protein [Olivibacter sp. CPCC 100613]|uniref:FecR family protein n=1 Tax=Olivibacter sp. CPCC 100613 TaxID=3079931 RepID=UPI002FF754EE